MLEYIGTLNDWRVQGLVEREMEIEGGYSMVGELHKNTNALACEFQPIARSRDPVLSKHEMTKPMFQVCVQQLAQSSFQHTTHPAWLCNKNRPRNIFVGY